MKIGILSGFGGWSESYRKACEELKVAHVMIDIESSQWMENIKAKIAESQRIGRLSRI